MDPLPRFTLGDSVVVQINNRRVRGTIVPYVNGVMVIHSGDLQDASEQDYRENYELRDDDDYYTANDELYAMRRGYDIYYIVLLPSGENIETLERDLLISSGNDALNRTVRNFRSRNRMNEMVGNNLPDGVFDHISSYFIETPLSTKL